jgi:hypothetical protein
MANPYDSHPIYRLRRFLLILSIFSLILAAVACGSVRWDSPVWIFHLLWTFLSVLFCIYDLVQYAISKARNPEERPQWPVKKVMIGDAIFIVLFAWWFCLELSEATSYYSSGALSAYASVTAMSYG